jgi:hypothetical protein
MCMFKNVKVLREKLYTKTDFQLEQLCNVAYKESRDEFEVNINQYCL